MALYVRPTANQMLPAIFAGAASPHQIIRQNRAPRPGTKASAKKFLERPDCSSNAELPDAGNGDTDKPQEGAEVQQFSGEFIAHELSANKSQDADQPNIQGRGVPFGIQVRKDTPRQVIVAPHAEE